VAFTSGCGDDGDSGASQRPSATATSESTTQELEAAEEQPAADPRVGGYRVACRTKTLKVEFSPDDGARFAGSGGDLTYSDALRTAPLYQYAKDCTRAGLKDGKVVEPYEIVEEAVKLRCQSPATIDFSGRAAAFDGRSGYEVSAAQAGTPRYFVKTHWEPHGAAYLLYSPKYCERS